MWIIGLNTGKADGLLGYGEQTNFAGVARRDSGGTEIIGINFESDEVYDLLGYGELASMEGVINRDRIELDIKTYDLLGYGESIATDLVINERCNTLVPSCLPTMASG